MGLRINDTIPNLTVETDQGDIALIKSIFERENVKYVVQGEINTPMGPLPVRFMVPKKQIEQVKEILKEVL